MNRNTNQYVRARQWAKRIVEKSKSSLVKAIRFRAKPPKQFLEWCRSVPADVSKDFTLSKYCQTEVTDPVDTRLVKEKDFERNVSEALRSGNGIRRVALDSAFLDNRKYELSGEGVAEIGAGSTIEELVIENTNSDLPPLVAFRNLAIRKLILRVSVERDYRIHLDRCWVGTLDATVVIQSSTRRTKSLTINNSHIGTLDVGPNSVGNFRFESGSIANIRAPEPEGVSPFSGSVNLSGVYLARSESNGILEGPQGYRNLRAHLRKLENRQMADLFHKAELIVERKSDRWTNRIVSWLYQGFSDFGTSILLPILWLVLLVEFTTLVVFRWNGGVLVKAPKWAWVGWREELYQPGVWGHLTKAIYLGIQPVVNPLGIFRLQELVVPASRALAVWLAVQGVLSVTLIALTIFAVRRRFRIQ